MTRDQRVSAALAGCRRAAPGATHRDAMVALLDSALADVGGLDGLERTLVDAADERDRALGRARRAEADLTKARSDRDRLREALREIAELPVDGSLVRFQAAVERACRVALRVSEAGT